MKLRLQRNSLRLRLTRSEVQRLRETGAVVESGGLLISIEKDFRRLARPLDERERDAYPHPAKPVSP